MPERESRRPRVVNKNATNQEKQPQPESREQQLARAVRGLLDALERCAGDPPDCPHCGPARAYALGLVDTRSDTKTDQAEQERVRLSGRAGADPTFRTTQKGTLIGRFPLAVRNPDQSTTWYPVVAFNQRAEGIRDVVHRGEALDVVGYVHTRQVRTRDGEPKTVREIYAVSVNARGMK